jgi:hypothetical protein
MARNLRLAAAAAAAVLRAAAGLAAAAVAARGELLGAALRMVACVTGAQTRVPAAAAAASLVVVGGGGGSGAALLRLLRRLQGHGPLHSHRVAGRVACSAAAVRRGALLALERDRRRLGVAARAAAVLWAANQADGRPARDDR